ncbi:hypothetical protein DFH07DRAFT_965313 [Mycena maculata]|uniref:Uncharacterized protein n=1 Tax=Mycena maculata TaxID=230809 RepID=A0AAD7N1N2_9AGAR|nr:hypothetical protein DFH07DRAFT_965313 [Mycena maculata]
MPLNRPYILYLCAGKLLIPQPLKNFTRELRSPPPLSSLRPSLPLSARDRRPSDRLTSSFLLLFLLLFYFPGPTPTSLHSKPRTAAPLRAAHRHFDNRPHCLRAHEPRDNPNPVLADILIHPVASMFNTYFLSVLSLATK